MSTGPSRVTNTSFVAVVAAMLAAVVLCVFIGYVAIMAHDLNIRTRRIDSELFRLESRTIVPMLDRLDRLEKERRP